MTTLLDEFEEWLKEELEYGKDFPDDSWMQTFQRAKDKLEELKEKYNGQTTTST